MSERKATVAVRVEGAALDRHEAARRSTPLELLAYPLMPADDARCGQVIEPSADWRFAEDAVDAEAAVVLWGRLPDSSPPRTALRAAIARETALRTLGRRIPARLRVAAIHRIPPRRMRTGGLHARLGSAMRGGAVAELVSSSAGERVLDGVLRAAGVRPGKARPHAGTGGATLVRGALADGSGVVLRLARAGAPGDPILSAAVLDSLSKKGVPLAPRLVAHGRSAGASWVVESALPGTPPVRATPGVIRQAAAACAAFPRGDGSPTATADDLADLARILPDRSDALTRVAREVEGRLGTMPSVMRHGDFWAGNLLVERGTLSGIVDWDSAHPAAVPGGDLLQLFATELRRRARRELGPAFVSHPWRLPAFKDATHGYFATFDIVPDEALLELVGIAWWATEARGTLTRLPHRADDERWVTTNVDPVLRALSGR